MTGGNPSGGHRPSHAQQYLEAAVRTATPARLRLMLLERAVEVASRLSASWRCDHDRGANERSLKLFDLLTELLSGVRGDRSGEVSHSPADVAHRVADLYVFLIQHLLKAERSDDHQSIDEIRLVLETEVETWRLVCAQEAAAQETAATATDSGLNTSRSGGLNLQV